MNEKQKLQFQCILLLEALVNQFKSYAGNLEREDLLLKPLFDELVRIKFVTNNEDGFYVATDLGKAAVLLFLERKKEFDKLFSVFSAVDLETGEFFWENELEFDITDQRWSDLRLAAAKARKMNVAEFGFLSFCDDEDFQIGQTSDWQNLLINSQTWKDIEEHIETSVYPENLTYEDEHETIAGEEIVEDIIKFGIQANLMKEKKSAKIKYTFHDKFDLIGPTTNSINVKSIRSYLKRNYVSPCWKCDMISGKKLENIPNYYW